MALTHVAGELCIYWVWSATKRTGVRLRPAKVGGRTNFYLDGDGSGKTANFEWRRVALPLGAGGGLRLKTCRLPNVANGRFPGNFLVPEDDPSRAVDLADDRPHAVGEPAPFGPHIWRVCLDPVEAFFEPLRDAGTDGSERLERCGWDRVEEQLAQAQRRLRLTRCSGWALA